MKPPLATEADRAALWANLDVVDCIATDHAPHTREEKEGEKPPPGVPGLETMLPLLLTAVAERRLTLERLVELTHTAPRRIFDLPEQSDTWVEVVPETSAVLSNENLHTKCGWTPFEGMRVQGHVWRLIIRNQTVFEDGQVLVEPGFGRVVAPLD
jgi:carbamoyl-phosphate synthase/aspartate carbamoyltransferase/dihydroorotase